MNRKHSFNTLYTPFEKEMADIPFCEYPRPAFKRNSYLCLNGRWDFSVKRKSKSVFSGSITVPFPPESRLSGAEISIDKKDVLTYQKSFIFSEDFIKDRVILHFGALDQTAMIILNGEIIGENIGGYIPFSFDITDILTTGENLLTIIATDPMDKNLPYGKQRKNRGGMWYTPVSGIWQTVWLESVPENYIKDIKITPTLDTLNIKVFGGEKEKQLIFGSETHFFSGDEITLDVKALSKWSPESPNIHPFTLISGEDKIDSYFALREIKIKDNKILLNGEPYFFNGLLDQGYFSDGIYLPASPEGYKNDILRMKELGFNTLRKHIKIEPQLFYYYCDIYGMAVFQDMVNSGHYSFIIDTALPTLFLKKGITHRASKKRRFYFEKTAREMVELLYNHPSVVYYTLFNEGWGQYDTNRLDGVMKSLDSTRVWDTASGWFKTNKNNIDSRHIYFKKISIKKKTQKPLIISEFGGYSLKIPNHIFNPDKNYGYGSFKSPEEFEDAIVKLYESEIIPAIKMGLCGTVLTQLSDVEDETNGLITYDRRVLKVKKERMQKLFKKLYDEFKNSPHNVDKSSS